MYSKLFKIIGFSVLISSFGLGGLLWQWQMFVNQPISERALSFELKPGASVYNLAYQLADNGVLQRPRWLVLLARLQGNATQIKAGEYLIPPQTSPKELLALLVAGKVQQHSITLVEGWNFRQVRAALAAETRLQSTLPDLDDQAVMARLDAADQHPEGWFFPDTYFFIRDTADIEILRQAYQRMQQVLASEWDARDAETQLNNAYEALILASIVEKETGHPDERDAIAGVFDRRLALGMRLQTDPTVIYGVGAAFDGNLTRRHLRTDTPYNTYRRHGLPPTPIAMPGRAAIHAALHPEPGDALYFVAKGNGRHQFSATLAEHNAAVRRYQLGR